MVNNCCVVGCKNYVGKKKGLSFYRFPLSDKERCSKWEAAVRRKDWTPKPSSRICNEHFVTGMDPGFGILGLLQAIVFFIIGDMTK